MKIIVKRKELIGALKFVDALVMRRGAEALRQVKLETSGFKKLYLRTTDLSAFTNVAIEATGNSLSPAEVLVDAKFLFSLIRSLGSEDVSFEFGGGSDNLIVASGGVAHTVSAFPQPESTFPEWITDGESSPKFTLPANQLREMIAAPLSCAADSPSRFAVNGVVARVQAGKLQLISLDGHRLGSAECSSAPDAKTKFTGELTLSQSAAYALQRIPGSQLEVRTLAKKSPDHAARWLFVTENAAVIAIDEKKQLPDCIERIERIEPDGASVQLDAGALAKAAEAAYRLAPSRNYGGRLSLGIKNNEVVTCGLDKDWRNPRFTMVVGKSAEISDLPVEVLDARYMKEAALALKNSKSLTLTFGGQNKPIRLTAETDGVRQKIIIGTIRQKERAPGCPAQEEAQP